MARGLNKVMLIGRLGRDPEMRYTPSGKPVTSFSMATSRSWNSPSGERRKETEWFNVVAWGSLAEICKQYLSKGQKIYIEGRIQTRQWEDADGNKHTSVEVVAKEMLMLGDRRSTPKDEIKETDSLDHDIEEPEDSGDEEFPF